MVEGLTDIIDERIDSIQFRGAIPKDEAAKLMDGLPYDFTPHREYLSRGEVQDMLLDARLVLMVEERENGNIQEELDAVLGDHLNAGGPDHGSALTEVGAQPDLP